MNLEARIQRNPWNKRVEVAIFDDCQGGPFISVAEPIVMKQVEAGMCIDAPTFELADEKAQLLLDELWRIGLRPTEGIENAGQLKATQDHLADMKKLTFDLFDVYMKPEEQENGK